MQAKSYAMQRSDVTAVLSRLRQSVPFPCKPREVEEACFPPFVIDALYKRTAVKSIPHENMMALTGLDYGEGCVMHGMLSFPMQPRDKSCFHGVFWYRGVWGKIPSEVDTPITELARVPSDSSVFTQLCAWMRSAMDLMARMDSAMQTLEKVIKIEPHPSVVERAWPNLAKIVRPRAAMLPQTSISAAVQQLNTIHEHKRHELEMLYATASLLPEKYTLPAWVGHFYQGVDNG